MNTTEKGKIFEHIIKAIQQVLEPEDSIIHTNKKLNGTRGEIDILIVRKNGKKEYTIAVECKNYKVPVSVVDAFYGKCHRLSNKHKIDEKMIVATGFQHGAIEAADFFNIKLCSLEMVQRKVVTPVFYLDTNQNICTFVLELKKHLNHEHRRQGPGSVGHQ